MSGLSVLVMRIFPLRHPPCNNFLLLTGHTKDPGDEKRMLSCLWTITPTIYLKHLGKQPFPHRRFDTALQHRSIAHVFFSFSLFPYYLIFRFHIAPLGG